MKTLFCGIGTDGLNEDRILRIAKELGITDFYGTYSVKNKPDKIKYNELLNFWKIINNDYSEYTKKIEIAIDENILNKMSSHDMEILFMYKRCSKKYRKFEKAKNSYYNHLEFWNNFLVKEKIGAVIFSTVPHEIYDYVIYCLCKIYNIKICFSDVLDVYCKEKRKVFLSTIEYSDYYLKRVYDSVIEEYRSYNYSKIDLPSIYYQPYITAKENILNLENSKKTVFAFTNRESEIRRYSWQEKINFHSFINNPLKTLLKLAKQKIRYYILKISTLYLTKYYDSLSIYPDLKQKFIYVPLHYTPECTSCPQGGGMYADQIRFISVLSKSLPQNMYLFIKEHPTQTAYGRSKEFYDELIKLDNVKLIKEDYSSYQLMKNCIAVSSLTGTSGYECQLIGKPFIMFGYYISIFAPGTIHVRNSQECKNAIKAIEENNITINDNDVIRYIKFIERVAVDINNDNNYIETVCEIIRNSI